MSHELERPVTTVACVLWPRFVNWPKACNNMKNLQRLYLTANSVTDLSEMDAIGAGCLTCLEELSMDMNQIAELPESVSKLTGLQELSLSDNDTLCAPPPHLPRPTAAARQC